MSEQITQPGAGTPPGVLPSPPAPAPRPPVDPGDLRVVLFGMPAAGKSSLLGALARAAEVQQATLGGKIVDESQGLADLRHQLYDATPRRTPEEVVPYPVRYEPLPEKGRSRPGRPIDAVLMDCDGRVANDLLTRRDQLNEKGPETALAHEVLDADALILVVDASAPPAQVEADFAEFVAFVRHFERGRKERAEVAGLPVFLVLTKCDLLARAGDSPADWMERIEQRKTEVGEHFREFVECDRAAQADQAGDPDGKEGEDCRKEKSPFGDVELQVWATAVKRPQLAGSPAKPGEPYGVAELFRQCLAQAERYRRSERRADRWLGAVSLGLVGLVALLLTLIVALYFINQSNQLKQLRERVELLRVYTESAPAEERLGGTRAELTNKIKRLEELRNDPLFTSLPEPQQEFVERQLKELRAYLDYYDRILAERDRPAEDAEDSLRARLARLEGELAVPQGWEKTRAAQERQRMRDRAEVLTKVADAAQSWFSRAYEEAADLWASASRSGNWAVKAREAIGPTNQPPFDAQTPLPHPPEMKHADDLKYADVLHYDRVATERGRWETQKRQLKNLLDVLAALRVIPPTADRPDAAVLEILLGFDLAEADARVRKLEEYYPGYKTAFTVEKGGPAPTVPDSIRELVMTTADEYYQALLRTGRAEVLRRLGGKDGKDWDKVKEWSQSPEGLKSWRVLALSLRRLRSPQPAEDPVSELAKFLAQPKFTIAPKAFILEVPERAGLEVDPDEPLTITHKGTEHRYKRVQTLRSSRKVAQHRYEPAKANDSFDVQPGDSFQAQLLVNEVGGGKKRLNWANARSSRFPFEGLWHRPRVEDVNNKAKYYYKDGLLLRPSPEDSVPREPDLLPETGG
jgi:hypothetical protein